MNGHFTRARGRALVEVLVVATMVAMLGLVASAQYERSQTRSKLSRTYSELQIQRAAVEAYTADWVEVPRMSWGEMSSYPVLGPTPACLSFHPTSWNERDSTGAARFGTLVRAMTTPVAYLSRLYADPFLEDAGGPLDPELYTYDSVSMHEYLWNCIGTVPGKPGFTYSPSTPAQRRIKARYFGDWVLWSVGPSETATDLNFWIQYDPTNGAGSLGHIYISQRHPNIRQNPFF